MEQLITSKFFIGMLTLLAVFTLCSASVPGPRGPVGPDVSLSADERAYFSERVNAEGFTATAVQAACNRARNEGIPVVYLPSGNYIFDTVVNVPEGVTLLGSGAKSHIHSIGKTGMGLQYFTDFLNRITIQIVNFKSNMGIAHGNR